MRPFTTAEKILAALGLGGVVLYLSRDKAPPLSREAPLTIIGDSFAVGMGASLLPNITNAWVLNPPRGDVGTASALDAPANARGRALRLYAKGGVPASIVAPDDGSLVILSTGSNECADLSRSLDNITASIVKALGPFATGEASKGYLYFHLPHAQMAAQRPQMAARCKALSERLASELRASPRLRFDVIGEKAAGDGIHFSRAGYQRLVAKAVEAFS